MLTLRIARAYGPKEVLTLQILMHIGAVGWNGKDTDRLVTASTIRHGQNSERSETPLRSQLSLDVNTPTIPKASPTIDYSGEVAIGE